MAIAWASSKAMWTLHIEPEQGPLMDKGSQESWKIEDLVSGNGNHNNNHILKGEIARELDSAAAETVTKAHTELNLKIERKKINEQENDDHSVCHSE